MTRHSAALCLAFLVAALLAGCAGTGGQRPPLQAEAESLNRRGLEQFQQGDLARAVEAFRQALLIEQSVENEDGMAVAWLNLSLAYQRQGQMEAAEAAVDAVLLDDVRTYPPPRLAELAMRKATLATRREDWAAATSWLEQSTRHCPRRCPLEVRQLNLRAHLALARGEPAEALAAAGAAQRIGKDDPAELANALRLAGAAHLALADSMAATQALSQALALDKQLRRSDRIFDDLLLLARASADKATEQAYLRRAGDVARAQGNEPALASIRLRLDENAPPPSGPESTRNEP